MANPIKKKKFFQAVLWLMKRQGNSSMALNELDNF